MKSVVILLVILFSLQTKAQHGWIKQQLPANVYEINEVFALNQNVVYAAADSGKILKTTDGGEYWNLIYQDSTNHGAINSIFFIDSLNGWAVSWRLILRTEDGGKNWSGQTFDYEVMLIFSAVYFVNKDTGWITGGGYGTIFKTIDGGKTWELKGTPASYSAVNDLYFSDSKNGFVVASEAGWGIMKHGGLLTTSDGGETWDYKTTENLYSLSFVNHYVGWLSGGPYLYFTNDGGKNWESRILNYNLKSIHFINESKGWAIGNSFILNTTDSGENWNVQDSVIGTTFNSLDFCNETTGWAGGIEKERYTGIAHPVIYKTISGGVSSVDISNYQIPQEFSLKQNYPNPFNPSTIINYEIPKSSLVTLKVYDVLGREVATLINEEKSAGKYNVTFNASKYSSGIYFYRITAGNFSQIKKMVLLK